MNAQCAIATRFRIPHRRQGQTVQVEHGGQVFAVTFNFVGEKIWECFCSPSETCKVGTDAQAIITDACIAISKLLQRGENLVALVRSLGENRSEGATSGPPSSVLGAIARAGIELEELVRAAP